VLQTTFVQIQEVQLSAVHYDEGTAYKKLERGEHVFRVKARDRSGNLDATPAVKRFKIKQRYSAATSVRAVATTSATSVARCSELVSGCRMQARSVSRPPKTVPVTKARPRA
jgi:hypothetical protein